jgi:hypothetical protein
MSQWIKVDVGKHIRKCADVLCFLVTEPTFLTKNSHNLMNNAYQDTESPLNLSIVQRTRLKLFGITPTTKKKLVGWQGELQFYAFKCPIHGIVEDYAHGYGQTLRCRKCQNNEM